MKKTPMTLGEAIYTARNEKGITLRGLATAVGVSAPFLSDVEHGRRRPSEERLTAIAKALGTSPQDLQDMALTREAAHALENDPELLALVRRCARDRRFRRLVLDAATTKRKAV